MIDRTLIGRFLDERVAVGDYLPQTAIQRHHILGRFVDFVETCTPAEITEDNVVAWLGSQPVSPRTKSSYLCAVRTWTAWLTRRGSIAVDPCAVIRGPRLPRRAVRVVERSNVAELFERCRDLEETVMVSLMVNEALRCMEVAGLRWGDITEDGLAFIRGKGRHERWVPISNETASLLAQLQPTSNERTIISGRDPGTPATPNTVSSRLAAIATRAAVDARAHGLRATAASDMLSAGAHLRDVQYILGHSRITTTGRYVRASFDDVNRAIRGRRYLPDPSE